MSEKNPSHVPWWQKKKYRYHQRDCIMGTKVRPGTKLKKMHPDCQHVLTEVNYRRMYQTKAKYWYFLCNYGVAKPFMPINNALIRNEGLDAL